MLHFPREGKTSGYAFLTTPDEGTTETPCLQCKHCQAIWQVQPGSGRQRGWCFRCSGPTCGKKRCEADCEPWEMQMERIEQKWRLDEAIKRAQTL